MRISIQSALRAAAACSLVASCAAPVSTEDEALLGSQSEAIINGTVPVRGSQASTGVVLLGSNVGGCSGTLVTNQHVVTARHCVRTWSGSRQRWGITGAPVSATLEGATAAGDQTQTSTAILEASSSDLAPDWALITLDEPMVLEGASDGHFNPIYSGSATGLDNKSVTCIGYGNSAMATSTATMTGFGTLRTAQLTIDSASSSFLNYKWNSSTQLQASGDSGSTCFYQGQITGVLSTCTGTGTDIDGSGGVDSYEYATMSKCTATAPAQFRSSVDQAIHSTVKVEYAFAPASLKSSATMVLGTPEETTSLSLASQTSASGAALRSGWLEGNMQEPARALCTSHRTVAPVTGDVTLRGSCLDDGIVAVLL